MRGRAATGYLLCPPLHTPPSGGVVPRRVAKLQAFYRQVGANHMESKAETVLDRFSGKEVCFWWGWGSAVGARDAAVADAATNPQPPCLVRPAKFALVFFSSYVRSFERMLLQTLLRMLPRCECPWPNPVPSRRKQAWRCVLYSSSCPSFLPHSAHRSQIVG